MKKVLLAAIAILAVTSCRELGAAEEFSQELSVTNTQRIVTDSAAAEGEPKDPPKDVPRDRDNWRTDSLQLKKEACEPRLFLRELPRNAL